MGKRVKREQVTKGESADTILAKAAKRRSDPAKFAKAAKYAAAAESSDRFEFSRTKSSVDGLPIHYFRAIGDSVTGVLAGPESELWKGVTYKIVQDDGVVIRLPGNRMLQRAIKLADALYQRVTITYKGKIYTRWGGHYCKVYTVTPAPLDRKPSKSVGDLTRDLAGKLDARKAGVK